MLWYKSGLKVAKLSRCFRTVLAAKRSVAVGFVSKPEICHGCRSFIESSARIRVQLSFQICLGSTMLFAKTVTSDLPLLSVLGLVVFYLICKMTVLSVSLNLLSYHLIFNPNVSFRKWSLN